MPPTKEEKQKMYELLSAPFPESTIERSDGKVTRKGYDTAGIKYQYIVNRLNEAVGLGNWITERTIDMTVGKTQSGRTKYDVLSKVTLYLGEFENKEFIYWAMAIGDGGHTGFAQADAIKGAYTNGFKKAAAWFGVGRQAYEGTLDDDNVPMDEPANEPPTQSDQKERVQRAIRKFSAFEVVEKDLTTFLQKPSEDWLDSDFTKLQDLYRSIMKKTGDDRAEFIAKSIY